MRAQCLLAPLLLAGPLAACRSVPPVFPGAPVILISIDTLRADHLPAYGYAGVRTPHLDRFREDAVLFANAYSPCPMTLPAHVTMLTGLLPPEHGVRNNVGFVFRSEAHPGLPSLLKARGYATGAAVSSYVLRAETGLAAIFDDYEDSIDPRPGGAFLDYQRPGDKTAAFAAEWIAQRGPAPFFFFLHIYEPHVPYEPPEPFRSEYASSPYDGEIAAADAIVGGFLEDLRRRGIYDRALVIVTSDHGEGLGDHGEDQHSILLYLEAIRVPLLLKLPGSAQAGRRVSAPAQLSDLLPTVAALLGLQAPKGTSGRALFDPLDADRPVYAETLYPRLQLGWSDLRSVVAGRYHYIHGPRPELYDMRADPGEKHDLVTARAEVAAAMTGDLERFPQGESRAGEVDPATAERLAALGYIGGLRDRGSGGSLPNPVDNLRYLDRMREGWRLAAAGSTGEAAAVLAGIVRDNPAMVEVWIKLGDVLAEEGRDDQAASAYQQALARSPVFLSDIAVSLGFAQLRRGRLTEAEAEAGRALASNAVKAHELLMRVALTRNHLDEAERQARAAAGGRNPQPSAMLTLAQVHVRKGELRRALEVLDRAQARARELRLGPVFTLEFLRADALARLNRPEEAEAAYRREIAAFPGHAQAYANLAVLRFLRRDRAGVEDVLAQMVAASPGRRSWLLAAAAYEAFGDKRRAEQWRRRAAVGTGPPSSALPSAR